MSFFKKHQNNLVGIGILSLIFFLSIQVRLDNLKAPLSRNHEWITAHSLITAEIWYENGGPSKYGFNPLYTYDGEGNRNNFMLGGIGDLKGDVYYVSYPPFSYLYLYYTSVLTGGPSVLSARIASLSIHFITALLLFFLLGAIRPISAKDKFNFAGVFAGALYIFAQGNLWFHGNLFFADMVVQPLIIAGLLLTVRYLKVDYKQEKRMLFLFFFVFFLATYTEWLGLFSAFTTGLAFLIIALIKRQKKFLKPFLVIGLGSTMALGLTVYQYSSIAGWENLKKTSESKYAERSGHETVKSVDAEFTMGSEGSLERIQTTFNSFFKATENTLGFTFIVLLTVFLASKIKRIAPKPYPLHLTYGLLIIGLLLIPILAHYLLFFNFNGMHAFSGMKTAALLIIISAIMLQLIIRIATATHSYYAWIMMLVFTGFFVLKAKQSVARYKVDNPLSNIDHDRVASALEIAKHSKPNDLVFANIYLTPEHVFYAKHNLIPLKEGEDTLTIKTLLKLTELKSAHYYKHDGNKLLMLTRFQMIDNNLVLLDSLKLD